MVAITKIILSATLLASVSAAAIRRHDGSLRHSSHLVLVSDPVLSVDTDVDDSTDAADINDLSERATSTATGISSSSRYGTEQVDDPVLQSSAAPKKVTTTTTTKSAAKTTTAAATTTTAKVNTRETASASSSRTLYAVTANSVFGTLVVGDAVLAVDTDDVAPTVSAKAVNAKSTSLSH